MVDKKIVKFLEQHHVLSLATIAADGSPYCCACFYAYDKEENAIIFTSDSATLHAQQMAADARVAISIVLETKVVGRIEGIQICGTAKQGTAKDKLTYIARFPYAAVMPLNIWRVEPHFMKLTDNKLGFGKKLIWKS